MITLRDLRQSDISQINDIYKRQPELGVPSLENMIINAVAEDTDNGKVLAYGAVKLFAEAVLILDHDKSISKKLKTQVLVEMMKTALLYSQDAGLEIIYAISNNESFTQALENRYKFVRVPGTLLCRDLTTFEDK